MPEDVKPPVTEEPIVNAKPEEKPSKPKTAAPRVGRQFPGQQHYAVTLPEEETKRIELQTKYDVEGAVAIDVYFAVRNIKDPVMKASMLAYTTVRRATMDSWDELFATH